MDRGCCGDQGVGGFRSEDESWVREMDEVEEGRREDVWSEEPIREGRERLGWEGKGGREARRCGR